MIFEATRLPLTVWFLAMHLLMPSKNTVLALELKRHLGGFVPDGLGDQAQAHAGQGGSRRGGCADGARGNRRCLLGWRTCGYARAGFGEQSPFRGRRADPGGRSAPEGLFLGVALYPDGNWGGTRQTLAPGTEVYSDALPSMKAGLTAAVRCHHAIRTGSGRQAVLPPEFRCVNTTVSTRYSTISKPPSRAPALPSTSPNMRIATWLKCSIASTGVSTCRSSFADCSAPPPPLGLIPFPFLDCLRFVDNQEPP
jgi:hypothetical protein